MLGKAKVWCQKKKEKGKEWISDHKIEIAILAGGAAMLTGQLIGKKLFEPKRWIGQVYNGYFDKDSDVDFAIGVNEIDRFGKEHVRIPVLLNESSRDGLVKLIDEAIAYTKAKRAEN